MNCNWIENKRRQIYYSKFKPCKPLGSSAVWQKTILFHVFSSRNPSLKTNSVCMSLWTNHPTCHHLAMHAINYLVCSSLLSLSQDQYPLPMILQWEGGQSWNLLSWSSYPLACWLPKGLEKSQSTSRLVRRTPPTWWWGVHWWHPIS